jgi:hypothetical protein
VSAAVAGEPTVSADTQVDSVDAFTTTFAILSPVTWAGSTGGVGG